MESYIQLVSKYCRFLGSYTCTLPCSQTIPPLDSCSSGVKTLATWKKKICAWILWALLFAIGPNWNQFIQLVHRCNGLALSCKKGYEMWPECISRKVMPTVRSQVPEHHTMYSDLEQAKQELSSGLQEGGPWEPWGRVATFRSLCFHNCISL